MGGKSGGSSRPTQQNVTQSNVPEYLRPQVERNIGMAEALVNESMQQGYQPYEQQRLADFTPLQNQAAASASRLGYSTGIFGTPQISATGAGYSSVNARDAVAAQSDYDPWAQLQEHQMDAVRDVGSERWTEEGVADSYMSPYMQNVVDIQMREAARQADILDQQRNSQLARAGAFGGSRQAIIQSEADRNRLQQLGDIQATGLQRAYEQGMGQFNQDLGRDLQAQLANQQAEFGVGSANLQALLGTQQLGTQAELETAMANLSNRQQAELANQQASLQAQMANQQASAQTSIASQQAALQAALANQQTIMDAQQMREASRQFGAGYGLDAIQAQMQLGTQQQAHGQAALDMAYDDFLNQQRYPYEQVGYMSDILRGQPMASSYSTLQPAPNAYSQYIGAGLGALGLSNALGSGG